MREKSAQVLLQERWRGDRHAVLLARDSEEEDEPALIDISTAWVIDDDSCGAALTAIMPIAEDPRVTGLAVEHNLSVRLIVGH